MNSTTASMPSNRNDHPASQAPTHSAAPVRGALAAAVPRDVAAQLTKADASIVLPRPPPATAEWIMTARDLVAGTMVSDARWLSNGACAGIVVGQPLDTVKTRMQSSNAYTSVTACIISTARQEGPRAFFKGLLSPLLGNLPINAIVFGARGNMDRMLDEFVPRSAADRASGRPSYWRGTVAALWAGWLQLVVLVPVELVKCKLQVQQSMPPPTPKLFSKLAGVAAAATAGAPNLAVVSEPSAVSAAAATAFGARPSAAALSVPRYAGPFDCAVQVFRSQGVRGLYGGFWVTAWRDVPAYAAWFVAYDFTKDMLTSDTEAASGAPVSTQTALIAGSVAGVATWVSTYPFDVLKSIIQTAPPDTPASQLKMAYVARVNYAQHGAAFFFRGLAPTVLRAIPVSAVTFYVYERCLDWFGR